MSVSSDSLTRLSRLSKRREQSLARWTSPPASTLPADSIFPATAYGDLVTEEKVVTTWNEFEAWVAQFGPRWSFRGQRRENWRLIPGLERRISRRRSASSTDGKRRITEVGMFPGAHEKHLFQEFERKNHDHTSLGNGVLGWLALMQHHGAPTRLLDWTRCPHVALYFALRSADTECAVWAIDVGWLEETSIEILRTHDSRYPSSNDLSARMQYVDSVLFEEHTAWNDHPVVISLTPDASIERMKAQKGHFLRSLSYDQPFDVSLLWMVRSNYPEPWVANRPVRKVIVTPCQRKDILDELCKMGIHDHSLFPGTDFAYDLRAELETRIKKDRRQWVKSVSLMLDQVRAAGAV